jgi:hypothetical protein
VRIRKSQKIVHQETMTFSTRSAAEKWSKRREVELEDPHVLALAKHGETTLASVIRWYIDSLDDLAFDVNSRSDCSRDGTINHLLASCDCCPVT